MAPPSSVAVAVQSEPKFASALGQCVKALRRIAEYELDPAINRRLRDLGERKEWLGEEEHEELLSLVAFGEKRTIEKLEAQLALKSLGEVVPEALEQR